MMAGILNSCVVEGMTVSRLITVQNLSYKVLRPLLEGLVSHGLVEYVTRNEYKYVVTTERGITALGAFDNAIALLNGRAPSSLSIQPHTGRVLD